MIVKKINAQLSFFKNFVIESKNRVSLNFLIIILLCFLLIIDVVLIYGFEFNKYIVRNTIADVAIFVLLCGYFSRLTGMLYAFMWTVLGILYAPIGELYGRPDKNSIESALNTDFSEALGFVSIAPTISYVKIAGLLILLILLFVFTSKQKNGFSNPLVKKTAWLVLFGMTAMSAVKALAHQDWQFAAVRLNEVTLSKTVYDAYHEIDKDKKIRSLFSLHTSWKLSPLTGTRIPECDICILIMGESVRKDFLGAYGAQWNNTPWLDRSPGLLLTNFISASNNTITTLSLSLFAPTLSSLAPWGDNIITLAKKAGYYTSWISIQTQHSAIDTPISKVGEFADYSKYVHQDVNYDQRNDRELLPYLKETLKTPKNKHFIFLHLYNSHPLACERTKGEYTNWFISKELSCYEETVRRTDKLLADIEQIVKDRADNLSLKWGLLYMADHGLAFKKAPDGWQVRHLRQTTQQAFEPPFFITGSGWHEKRLLNARRSGIYFSQIVAAWLGYDVTVNESRYPGGHSDLVKCDWFADVECKGQTLVKPFDRNFLEIDSLPSRSLQEFAHNPIADGKR